MNIYCFAHGKEVECPECPASGEGNRKPHLNCVHRNYSGAIDIGQCGECGKSWEVAYTAIELARAEGWDGETKAQREERGAREARGREGLERAELARLKAKYDTK